MNESNEVSESAASDKSWIIQIGALSGGDEAHILAEMMLSMYQRWAFRNALPVEVLGHAPVPQAGLKWAAMKFFLRVEVSDSSLNRDSFCKEQFALLHDGVHAMVRRRSDDSAHRYCCFVGLKTLPGDFAADPVHGFAPPQDPSYWGEERRRYIFDPLPGIRDSRLGALDIDPRVVFDGDFSVLESSL